MVFRSGTLGGRSSAAIPAVEMRPETETRPEPEIDNPAEFHVSMSAITNEEVRRRTGQPPVTSVIAKRRLRLFGHLARADPSQDHSRILRATINRPPADWRHRAGRPRRTWLRTIELDLRPYNLGLNTAWMRA